MKKDISKIVLYLLILFLAITCKNKELKKIEYSFENIEKKITSIVDSNKKEIDISKLMPFEWDAMYMFKPYTSIESIDNNLGFIWESPEKTYISQEEYFYALVFTKNNKVISYIKWPINMGDFMRIKNIKFPYDSAKFIFKNEKYGGQDWLFIYEKK
ncbi:MAG: hypothetical protein GKR88_21225 [Flavobacteriaceae bacterium]|nr:MAG: hypothetical protein GKR88_21225 [Flavobacteriaceae bacterium]